MQGGCGTLLPLFFNALQHAREAAASPMVAPRGASIELQDFQASAFVDPQDPSVLFVPAEMVAEEEAPRPEAYPGGV